LRERRELDVREGRRLNNPVKILGHLVPVLVFVSALVRPNEALAQLTLLTNLPSNDGGGGGASSSEQLAVSFTILA